jgi:hypothetical protein
MGNFRVLVYSVRFTEEVVTICFIYFSKEERSLGPLTVDDITEDLCISQSHHSTKMTLARENGLGQLNNYPNRLPDHNNDR